MSRQRDCLFTITETVVGPNSAVLSRRLDIRSPYDPIFKDVIKALPGARWHTDEKIWYVELASRNDDAVRALLSVISSFNFIDNAYQRQMSISWSREVTWLADRLLGNSTPTLFNYAGSLRPHTDDRRVEVREMPNLMRHLNGNTQHDIGTILPPVPHPAHGQQVPPYVPHGPVPVDDLIEPSIEAAEIDGVQVALAGSYAEAPDTKAEQVLGQVPDSLREYYVEMTKLMPTHLASPFNPGDERELYELQREGLAFIYSRIMNTAYTTPGQNVVTLLAHDPSLGKTTTAVAFAKIHPFTEYAKELPEPYKTPIKRIVVVCPERARTTWKKEFEQWTKRDVFRYGIDDRAGARWSESRDGVLVVGYSSIIRESFVDKLGIGPFEANLLIVDEVRYLSNNKSKRSIAVRTIAKRFIHTITLDGTPMLAKPIELFPLLNMADDRRFGNYWKFATRYCDAKRSVFGWDVSGSSNIPELAGYMREFMHRVRRSQAQLPELRRIPVPIDIEDRGELEDAVAKVIGGMGVPGASAHAATVKARNVQVSNAVRQIVYDARRDETIEWLVDWAKGNPGRKLLVFAWNKTVVEDVVSGLTGGLDLSTGTIEGVTGDTPVAQRDAIVKRFNEDGRMRFLVATIASMGDVYSMHERCDDGVFVQYDWTPGTMKQAELRLGRSRDGNPVNWYYLCAANTVDERMLKVLLDKQATFNTVIDGGEATPDYDDMIKEILSWKAQYDVRHQPKSRLRPGQ